MLPFTFASLFFFPQHPNRCSIWLSLSDRENTLEALYQADGVSMKNETILSLGKLTNLGWRRKMKKKNMIYQLRNQRKKSI